MPEVSKHQRGNPFSKVLSYILLFPFLHKTLTNLLHHFPFKGGSNDSQLQTSLGKSVAVVLGVTPDVVLFDKARNEYKKHPKDTYCYERFLDELVKIQTGVLKKQRELNVAFREWDKNYYLKNNHLPTSAHVNQDEEGKELTRKLKYAKVLLREWKMDFTS